MEASTNLAFGLCCPRFPPAQPRRHCFPIHAGVSNGGAPVNPSTATFSASRWADRLFSDFQFYPTTITTTTDSASAATTLSSLPPSLTPPDRHLSIPLNFYQVLGAEAHFLGDGIRRAFEARVSKPPLYGYSQDALISRRQILQAACETLSDPGARTEYNLGLSEAEEETVLTDVPFDKVPGALCVLQEAGESELVLRIGDSLLKERLSKSFKHDVVLAMALAYVDMSRDAMALSPPNYVEGCEALERALRLMQEEGSSSLAPDLQAQIDDTLEEITPRCVLDLLALPLSDEYRNKRAEALQGVRNILWSVGGGGATAIAGGYTREDFMNEAFLHMTAAEQVDLFVATPSNIPAENFEVYGVALALVSQAFISKKPYLIQDADNLFQQLQQNKAVVLTDSVSVYAVGENREIDFALERSFCSLLVGDLEKCRVWLGLDSESSPYRDPSVVDFILENSKDDQENETLPGLCKLLETWLVEVVFPRFRETKGVQFKLGDYYDDPTVLRYLEKLDGVSGSPLAAAAAIVRLGAEATAVLDNVRASAVKALRKVFPRSPDEESIGYQEDIQINDTVVDGNEYAEKWGEDYTMDTINLSSTTGFGGIQEEEAITDKIKDASIKIMCAGLVVGVSVLVGMKYFSSKNGSSIPRSQAGSAMASDVIHVGSLVSNDAGEAIPKMDARLAESVVRKWQNIKSEALGRNHLLEKLPEVLDGKMLKIWMERANQIAERGWFWDYTFRGVTIDSVTVALDGRRAMVEATVEESAKFADKANSEHNDSYNRAYTTRSQAGRSATCELLTPPDVTYRFCVIGRVLTSL
ncbi:Protein ACCUMULATION AND REPLICATION OF CHLOROPLASTS 6 [Dionaea muscipula]